MKGSRRVLIAPVWVAILVAVISAGKLSDDGEWRTKPFQTWTKSEVTGILNNSPWAKTQEARSVYGVSSVTDFKFTLRLRSALPIRQALVRLKQLEAKYDKLDEKGRAAFDAKTKGLLDCPACADYYVLSLSSRSENSPGWDMVYRSYSHMTLDLLKENVFLRNEKGEQQPLAHFVPPKTAGEEAVFYFPRRNDKGEALFDPTDKKIRFYLNPQEADSVKNFEFDVAGLVLNGKVEF